MSQSDSRLKAVIKYMKAHWPSTVKPEWQVKIEEYPEIVKKVLAGNYGVCARSCWFYMTRPSCLPLFLKLSLNKNIN